MTMVSGTPKPPTFREKLETFYKQNAPEKLQEPKHISKLVTKYRGREKLLFKQLHEKYPPKSFDFSKAYEDIKESAINYVDQARYEPKNMVMLLLTAVYFVFLVQWSCQALFSSKPKHRRSKKAKVAVEEIEEDDDAKEE
eukprot:CAMPEP_0118921800 /NCGR_PEP_ID=MMETSP1169-20130426/962_1 /TAXON_ID=36882 /ORGANISM="Pyramimonas obovata, Strain CCMP722" /LENGTH=139 /DNA_ID=CAMNT_0006862585 /DNA_START=187 /DNA_END=606 /DNA_ORIENTATION=+